MKRFERFGVVAQGNSVEQTCKHLFATISQSISQLHKYDGIKLSHESGRSLDIANMENILLLEHLEIPHPFPNPRKCVSIGAKLAEDYLFGDWRKAYFRFGETLDEAQCREQLSWVDEFRSGLLLALIVNDSEIAKTLSSYLEGVVREADPDEDGDYLTLLAHLISGEPSTKYPGLLAQIEHGRRKQPRLLLKAALAWEEQDGFEFQKALIEVIKHFRSKNFDPKSFVHSASVDGSILWNLARLSGLKFEPLREELMEYIITDKSLSHSDSR